MKLNKMYIDLDKKHIKKLSKREMRKILIKLIQIDDFDAREIIGSVLLTDEIADILRGRK